jgi:undecaprenyl-diphosphatase
MGVLFEEAFESTFRSTVFVAMFLIIGSLLMTLAEIFIRKKDKGSEIAEKDKAEDPEAVYGISYLNSFVVGIFQSFALFPGISRSGSTISAGIFSGLNRESAARFSFLLSVPIILAAAVYKISISYTELMLLDLTTVIAGFFSSFILGLISIKFLLKYLKNNKLHFFIVYRILMAGVLLAFFI